MAVNTRSKNRFITTSSAGLLVKDVFDAFCALLGMLVLLPFLGILAFLILHDSPGPVFYWCPRIGVGGRPFRMLKFRTMYERPSSYAGPRLTCKEDPRITPFGRWLRDTKINELPQIWNVLKGEMSLVGPRPEDPEIVQNWPRESKEIILSVKPGITSPASILYHNEEELLSSDSLMRDYYNTILPDKMRLDRLYVRNRTFWSDLDVLFWTFAIILPKIVKTRVPEEYLFAGLISRVIKRYISWFLIDLLTSLVVVGGVAWLWGDQGYVTYDLIHVGGLAVVLSLLFSGINALSGLNRTGWSTATFEDGVSLVLAGAATMVFTLLLNGLHSLLNWPPFPSIPSAMLLTIGILEQVGFVAARYRWRMITFAANCWLSLRGRAAAMGERVLIVGAGEGMESATWLLRRRRLDFAFTIIGIVDDDRLNQLGMRVKGCPVIGRVQDIPELVRKHDIGLILVTWPESRAEIQTLKMLIREFPAVRIVFVEKLIRLIHQQLLDGGQNVDARHVSGGRVAFYDPCTGLANKQLFEDRLNHSLAVSKRAHTGLAVLHIDLDGSKAKRDPNFEEREQTILQESAARLAHSLRESDTLACLGKHEFAIILENIEDQKSVRSVMRRINKSLDEPFQIGGNQLHVRARMNVRLVKNPL